MRRFDENVAIAEAENRGPSAPHPINRFTFEIILDEMLRTAFPGVLDVGLTFATVAIALR